MKLIIPLAGKGTRLLPLTREVPKPLVSVAGRTVLDYVMDIVGDLEVDELIVITGHLKEKVEDYIREHIDVPARFVEQKVQDGTAGAINLARPYVDGPVLIVFVDTLFEADLSIIDRTDADGIMWAKEVEDYQRFGVIVTDEDGNMTRIVEKPSEPVSRLANIGVYYVKDSEALFRGIDWTLEQPPMDGEYFLTDAFQHMIDNGRKLKVAEVQGWYDCGKLGTTLETNAHLLATGRATDTGAPDGVTVVPPVRIGEGVVLRNATVGPDVTLGDDVTVEGSVVTNSIVGRGSRISDSTVADSLLGDEAAVKGQQLAGMIVTREESARAP